MGPVGLHCSSLLFSLCILHACCHDPCPATLGTIYAAFTLPEAFWLVGSRYVLRDHSAYLAQLKSHLLAFVHCSTVLLECTALASWWASVKPMLRISPISCSSGCTDSAFGTAVTTPLTGLLCCQWAGLTWFRRFPLSNPLLGWQCIAYASGQVSS